MTTELTILGWTLVLALVQILLPSMLRSKETGLKFNMSARDGQAPPPAPVTARLMRAQANLFETLPLFIGAVLIAHVAQRTDATTLLGCQIYLAMRVIYLPLYAAGIPMLRSLVWVASIIGLVMIFKSILA